MEYGKRQLKTRREALLQRLNTTLLRPPSDSDSSSSDSSEEEHDLIAEIVFRKKIGVPKVAFQAQAKNKAKPTK